MNKIPTATVQNTIPSNQIRNARPLHRPASLTLASATAALLLLGTMEGMPASLILFDFTGDDPGMTQNWMNTSELDPHITTTGFLRGDGILGASGDNRYSGKGWTMAADLGLAIGENDYMGFTVIPEDGYTLNLGSASAEFTLVASGSGPKQFALMSSIDGFSSSSPAALTSGSISGTANIVYTFPDTGFDGLSGPLEFRIYGLESGGSSGTMGVTAFGLGGSSVTAVPEPGTLSLLSGFLLTAMLGKRAFRRRT